MGGGGSREENEQVRQEGRVRSAGGQHELYACRDYCISIYLLLKKKKGN